MADVNLNALIDGLSGRVGKNIVLRQRGGRTFMGTRPTASTNVSDKQLAQRERFQQAVRYARTSLLVPAVKAEYDAAVKEEEFLTAFTAAVTDFLKAPEIASVDVSAYKGAIGNTIIVRSTMDYKLISVKVSIQQPDGTVMESGDATSSATRVEWLYAATKALPIAAGWKIVVTAMDRPGVSVTKEQVL